MCQAAVPAKKIIGNIIMIFSEINSYFSVTDNYTWPILTLPCLIIGSWLMCVGIGFIILAIKNQELPNYFNRVIVPVNDVTEEIKIQDEQKDDISETQNRSKNTLICLGVTFFFLFCGIDSYFQSQTYTYGLCGPLGMSAESAGWLNSIYFGKFTYSDLNLNILFSKFKFGQFGRSNLRNTNLGI